MPKTAEQNKKIKEEKREIIISTALTLFAEKGFYNTSMEKIAKQANISKGLIYNYFESKDVLLEEIIRTFVETSWRYFDINNDGILTNDEFFFFIKQSFAIFKENPKHWKLYSVISMQPDIMKKIQFLVEEYSNKILPIMMSFFSKINSNNPTEEMLFFSCLLKGATIQYVNEPEKFPIEIIEKKIIDYYTNLLNQKK